MYRSFNVSSRPKIKFGLVPIGETPRVVGVISSLAAFHKLNAFPCDIAEVRLDILRQPSGWLKRCQEIEASGSPVLLTMRLKSEGGSSSLSDEARLPIFRQALQLSAVDVELRSKIAAPVAQLAASAGKACVLSYHDFEKTPPLSELEAVVAQAEALGGIPKIATMIHSLSDVKCLTALLKASGKKPLCVIGMGSKWQHLRVELAKLGSCLTYGYLDKSAAPGQMSAAALSVALRLNPTWHLIEDHHIEREYKFSNFRQALAFTNKIGALAERLNHHPDVFLAWGKVKLTLWTHSVGGLSASDIAFAEKADKIPT